MFERFTEGALQVVTLSHEEARALRHNYIGTEHILLGLLREEWGFAARALSSFDITVERLRAQVVGIVGRGEEVRGGAIPFTENAQETLERSVREADGRGHQVVGTEHVLLGLLDCSEGVAARVLRDCNTDLGSIRNELLRMIAALPKRAWEASGGPSPDDEGLQTNPMSRWPPPHKIKRRTVHLDTTECERGQLDT
jgi:ATP-dependent Clp protease ATP-binding subunit ClpC